MTREDRELVDSFEGLTLPLAQWNQRTHVSIAYVYLREHGFDGALDLMRCGVKAFNEHYSIAESPTSGYNETTTVAFLRIIDSLDRAYDPTFPTQSSTEFCDTHPQLMSKHVLRFFYSPGRRMDPDAKAKFVEPDITQLPE